MYSKSKGGGFVYILAFTPELWTQALTHRTQILFSVDVAMVAMHLSLRPGSVVVESGTGSGSLTTSLARAVAPAGHVYTFEFNADRARKAVDDFARNGMSKVVTVQHRDVCGAGFGAELADKVDGVFLDLPQPWLALPHAHLVLKQCGLLCSFSPCMEQVQRTSEEMRRLGFEDVRTIEALLRPYEVNYDTVSQPLISVFGSSGSSSGSSTTTSGSAAVVPARAANVINNSNGSSSSSSSAGASTSVSPSRKRSRPTDTEGDESKSAAAASDDAAGSEGSDSDAEETKKKAIEESDGFQESGAAPAAEEATPAGEPAAAAATQPSWPPRMVPFPAPAPFFSQQVALTPNSAIRGHTGFLTFATLYRKKPLPAGDAAVVAAAGAMADAAGSSEGEPA